jgi:hypothetical protein
LSNNIHQLNVTVIKSAGKDHSEAMKEKHDLGPMIKEACEAGLFKALEMKVAKAGKRSLIAQLAFKSRVAGLGDVQVGYTTTAIGSGSLTDAEKVKVLASAGKGNVKVFNCTKVLLSMVEQGAFSNLSPRTSQQGSLGFFVSEKGNAEVGAVPLASLKKSTTEQKAAILRDLM